MDKGQYIQRTRIAATILLLLVLVVPAWAQPTSKEEVAKIANKHFKAKEFSDALPMFSQLVSLEPRSADYNFKFGTCLLFADQDHDKAIIHLKYAASQPNVDPECFYYFGRAYHLNYRFQDALVQYQKFKQLGDSRSTEYQEVGRQIEMCNNGRNLLKNITDLVVMDKEEIREREFFRLYNLDDIGGRIIVKPTDLYSSYDKKVKDDRSLIHLPARTSTIYYSSYGKDGKNGKDLYQVQRLPDGTWGKPQIVKGPINTPYDEDFPYMHPDGKTLYFCSKGHNSMGGFDVFKSIYNENTGAFGPPKNLDFAINTPDDDLFYIVDSLDNLAYFASGRSSNEGMLHVYRVRVERIPVLTVLLKGEFINETGGKRNANITVEDDLTKEVVGIFNANNKGSYLISVPKSGTYNFLVECGSQGLTHTGTVNIPYQDEIRTLKQEMILKEIGGNEQLAIRNLFDQDGGEVPAEFFLANAKLDANYNPEVHDPLLAQTEDAPKTVADAIEEANFGASMDEQGIINEVFEKAETINNEAEALREDMEIAYYVADQKASSAKEKARLAEAAVTEANAAPDPMRKQELMRKANDLKTESQLLSKDAAVAYNLARNLEDRYNEKSAEYDLAYEFAKKIEAAVTSDSYEESIAALTDLKSWLAERQTDGMQHVDAVEEARRAWKKKETEARLKFEFVEGLRNDQSDLERRLSGKRHELDRTKKEGDKEFVRREIEALEEQYASYEEEVEFGMKEVYRLDEETKELRSQLDMLERLQDSNIGDIAVLDPSRKQSLGSEIEQVGSLTENIAIDESLLTGGQTEPVAVVEDRPLDEGDIDETFLSTLSSIEEGDGTEADKAREKTQVNESFLTKVDGKLEELNDQYENTTDEDERTALTTQIASLEELRSTVESDNESLAEVIANDGQTEPVAVVEDRPLDEGDIDETFLSTLSTIDEGDGSEADKAREKTQVNESFLTKVDGKLEELNDQYENTTDEDERTALTTQITSLEELRSTVESDNESLAEVIANDSQTEPVAVVEDRPLDEGDIDDTFLSTLSTIDEGDGSEADKAREKTQVNESFLTKVDGKLEELNDQYENTTDEDERTALTTQITSLEELRSTVESDNESLAEVIANDGQTEPVAVVEDRPLDEGDIDETFLSTLSTIDEGDGSEADKAREKTQVNESFLTKVDGKLEELNDQYENTTDEDERTALTTQITSLEELRSTVENDNESLAEVIANDGQTEPVAVVEDRPLDEGDIDETFLSTLSTIDEGDGSEADKAREKTQVNESFLTKVDGKLEELNDQYENTTDEDERTALTTQITSLEELRSTVENDNESLAEVIANDGQTEPVAVVEDRPLDEGDIDETFLSTLSTIDEGDGSEADKAREKTQVNESFLTKVDGKLEELNDQYENTTDEDERTALTTQITSLEELRSTVESDNETLATVIANDGQTEPVAVVEDRPLDEGDIDDTFLSTISSIDAGDGTEADKAREKTQVNESFLTKIDSRLEALNNQYENTSDEDERTALTTQMTSLEELRSGIQSENETLATLIAEGDVTEPIATVEDRPLTPSDIDEEFVNTITAIEAGNGSEVEKATEKTQINEAFLVKLEDRLEALNTQYESTTDEDERVALSTQISSLEDLRSDIESENETLAELIGTDVEPVATVDRIYTEPIALEDINADYRSELLALDESDRPVDEVVTEKTRINNELISSIDDQLGELRRIEGGTPEEQEAIATNIARLEEIKQVTQTRNDLLAEGIANEVLITQAATADDVDPDYRSSLEYIDDNYPDSVIAARMKTEVNNAFLSKLDEREVTLVDERAGASAERQEQIDEYLSTIDGIREDIRMENEEFLALSEGVATAPTLVLADIDPEYEGAVTDIQNSSQSQSEKDIATTEVNASMLERLDQKLEDLRIEEAAASGSERTALSDQIGQVERMQSSLLVENEALLARIAENDGGDPGLANTAPIITDVDLDDVYPNYRNELLEIENSDRSEYDKVLAKTALNERVIGVVDGELASLESQAAAEQDPTRVEQIGDRSKRMDNIKMERLLDNINLHALADELEGDQTAPADRVAIEKTYNDLRDYGDPLTFETPEAQSQYDQEVADKISAYQEINDELEALYVERTVYEDEKDIAKVDKKIERVQEKWLEQSIALGEEFANLNPMEYAGSSESLDPIREEAIDGVPNGNPVRTQGEVLESNADKYNRKADEFRDLAANASNEVDKDSFQRMAHHLEWLAIEEQERAREVYEYMASDEFRDGDQQQLSDDLMGTLGEVLIVSDGNPEQIAETTPQQAENPGDQDAQYWNDRADEWQEEAIALQVRADFLEDSATGVRPKFRAAIVEEAQGLRAQASELEEQVEDALVQVEKLEEAERLAALQNNNPPDGQTEWKLEQVAFNDPDESQEYNEYMTYRAQSDFLQGEGQEDKDEADALRRNASAQVSEAGNLLGQLDEAPDDSTRQQMIERANELNEMSAADYAKADSLDREGGRKFAQASVIYEQSEKYLNELDETTSSAVLAAVDRNHNDGQGGAGDVIAGNPEVNVSTDPLIDPTDNAGGGVRMQPVDYDAAPVYERNLREVVIVPETVTEELFATTNQANYSDDNPIPLDVGWPEGLFYKVQVGAFRNPIPQSHFDRFAPIHAESTDIGFTRYTVGFFTRFGTANDAKNEVRGMGYSDAFVVAFYNGKRIPIGEARRIQTEGGDVLANNTGTGQGNPDLNPAGSGDPSGAGDPAETTGDPAGTGQDPTGFGTDPTGTGDPAGSGQDPAGNQGQPNTAGTVAGNTSVTGTIDNEAPSIDVDDVKGLFYTVQIGFYSKPVSADALYNITPLTRKQIANGYRYTTGIFDNLPEAVSRKNEVVQIGVEDAFVTAYYDGERISLPNVPELIEQHGSDILVSGNSTQGGNTNTTPSGTNPNQTGSDPTPSVEDVGEIRFEVWLGEYETEVPAEVADAILQMMGKGIRHDQGENGATVYSSGNFSKFVDAEQLRGEFVDAGISEARIVATQNGQPIQVEEARRLTNQ